MTLLIDNKCARIWAFDEMIDNNTYHDGLSLTNSIQQLKTTIDRVNRNNNINHRTDNPMNNTYLSILNEMKIFDNIGVQNILSNISSLENSDSVYYSCGWIGHAITIFVTKIDDNNFDLGIINCGQGIEFQGYNNTLCNGLIIFHNIDNRRITQFLTMYKNYCDTTKYRNHPNFMIYRSFYLLLFKVILNKDDVDFNIQDNVDFNIQDNNIRYYKLPKQTIGSCFFTNTVIIVYYLYIIYN